MLINKLIYEGEFKNGKSNGQGKGYVNNILIFKGEFKNGKRWKGKCIKEKEEDYLDFEGEILNNKKHGKWKNFYLLGIKRKRSRQILKYILSYKFFNYINVGLQIKLFFHNFLYHSNYFTCFFFLYLIIKIF